MSCLEGRSLSFPDQSLSLSPASSESAAAAAAAAAAADTFFISHAFTQKSFAVNGKKNDVSVCPYLRWVNTELACRLLPLAGVSAAGFVSPLL
jgi:hypothetical protein